MLQTALKLDVKNLKEEFEKLKNGQYQNYNQNLSRVCSKIQQQDSSIEALQKTVSDLSIDVNCMKEILVSVANEQRIGKQRTFENNFIDIARDGGTNKADVADLNTEASRTCDDFQNGKKNCLKTLSTWEDNSTSEDGISEAGQNVISSSRSMQILQITETISSLVTEVKSIKAVVESKKKKKVTFLEPKTLGCYFCEKKFAKLNGVFKHMQMVHRFENMGENMDGKKVLYEKDIIY